MFINEDRQICNNNIYTSSSFGELYKLIIMAKDEKKSGMVKIVIMIIFILLIAFIAANLIINNNKAVTHINNTNTKITNNTVINKTVVSQSSIATNGTSINNSNNDGNINLSNNISTYQDSAWKEDMQKWNILITKNIDDITIAAKAKKLNDLEKNATNLKSNSNNALIASQKFSVSPQLQTAKKEHELALTSYKKGADEILRGIKEIDMGAYQPALNYLNEGMEHTKKAQEIMNNSPL